MRAGREEPDGRDHDMTAVDTMPRMTERAKASMETWHCLARVGGGGGLIELFNCCSKLLVLVKLSSTDS